MIKVGSIVKAITTPLGYDQFQNCIGVVTYIIPSITGREYIYRVRFVSPVYQEHVSLKLYGHRLEEIP